MKKKEETRSVMPEAMLRGWKRIAEFMDMSIDTLKGRHAKSKGTEHPLPLFFDGGTVVAIPEDLRAWVRQKK